MQSRRNIRDDVQLLYEKYFNVPVIRDVNWAPSIACTSCIDRLKQWAKKNVTSMPFGVPMIWTDPGDHEPNNCYVCMNEIVGMNRRKKKRRVAYNSIPSAQTPLPHSENVPVPVPENEADENAELEPPSLQISPQSSDLTYQPSSIPAQCPHHEVDQKHLDRMTRDAKLSQTRAIIIARHLSKLNLLAKDVKIYGAYGRQRGFMQFFESIEDNTFAFCNDIGGLMEAMGHTYNAADWRLFIDASKSSLKAVLLYVDNSKNPVPVAISTKTKETYDSMKKIIDSIAYNTHLWKICADLKVVSLLRGLQLGYTKNMCYLCQWNTRYADNQYQKRDWRPRQVNIVGQQNVINVPLVPMEKILLPPLHIKLGLVKNFIKALVARKNERAFHRLERIFSRLSKAKIKEGEYTRKKDSISIKLYYRNIRYTHIW